MLNNDNKSIIINIISKSRSYPDKWLIQNKKNHRATRNCIDELNKYNILPDEVTLQISKLKQSEIILPFKHYCKQQDRDRFKRRLSISIYDKYKIVSTDLQKRLHVNDPVYDVYSVVDVDADYYKYSKGRPLQSRNPVYKYFKDSINQILQLKLQIGLKKDCNLNKEINYRNELDTYSLSVKSLTDQAKYFDAFISEDYEKSIDFLYKWDKVKFQVDLKNKELQNLAIQKFTLKSRLIGLEYKFSIQLKYGRFLYYISPPIWRLNNREFAKSVEIEAKGFDYGNSHDDDTFPIIFEKLRQICFSNQIKPVLYFTQPKDLMGVFNALEKQQLLYYTHVNHLTPLAKILKEEIKSLKEVISQEYAVVANLIKNYENLLTFSKDRSTELELKFYKILFGSFYNSVGDPDILKLILHLEFCYEKVFLEKPINADITVLAKSIEMFWMDYSKRLDEIQNNTVRSAMLKCVEAERSKAEQSKHAAHELRLFHRLEQELLKAYGMDGGNMYKPIKKRSYSNQIKRRISSRKPMTAPKERKPLTEVEMEFLLLFTDWTETEDPTYYLQSLTSDDHKDDDKLNF
ncbi:cilia- and flagella-associated protein 100-like [Pararge aegeria]|uniref:cilia- and flagella-associated protein 100-like n=1 Tax=Pararge aegeria TaxID=116150 RepID=UPI0019D00EA5|nr:cilia- and flagella-associated protein 100-like [Pararge aegeria]